MTIRFNREDALTCCSCFIEKPSFRLISLELVPGKDEEVSSPHVCRHYCVTSVSSRSWMIFIDPWNKPKFLSDKEKPRMSFSIVKSAFWLSLFPSATRRRDSWPANCRPTG